MAQATQEGSRPEESEMEGFLPIHLRTLQCVERLDFDLYIRTPSDSLPTLYREASLPFEQERRKRLIENNVDMLWVRAGDRVKYRHYVERHLEPILADLNIPIQARTALLYESCQELVKDVLLAPHSRELMKRSGQAVQHIVNHLYGNHEAFACLVQLTWHDYETYTHSVDVCVFATALACRVGFHQDKAREVSLGALLHDVGKSMIDTAILKRDGPLSAAEWSIMRRHPVESERILREHGITSRIVLDIARHHHEKLTGDGYPDRLPAKGITPWVRIVTIADIFSALTTQRSFGRRMHSFEALQLMRDEMGAGLDRAYLREFIKLLSGK
jgi:putative nucleotidyltransferase with HDIG domain